VVQLPNAPRLQDKGTAVVSTVPVGDGAIAVQLDGTWVGHLLGGPHIATYLDGIIAQGLPATAKVRFHGGPAVCFADPDVAGVAIHSVGPVDPRSGGPVSRSGRWVCDRCGLLWYTRPGSVPQGDECPECGSYYYVGY
jgi:hypothetical protein